MCCRIWLSGRKREAALTRGALQIVQTAFALQDLVIVQLEVVRMFTVLVYLVL